MAARAIRRRAVAALPLLLIVAGSAAAAKAAGRDAPRVVAVEPARSDSLLVCRLRTAGLPGGEAMSTLHSGLASAVDLQLEVLDGDGREIDGRVLRVHLGYDLWEEYFTVGCAGRSTRLDDEDALRAWLAETPWLPVAPLRALAGSGPWRLRAALRLHAIAPSERSRLETMVAGPDRQEVSVGLGRLIRFFYHGGGGDRAAGAALSSPFTVGGLDDATH